MHQETQAAARHLLSVSMFFEIEFLEFLNQLGVCFFGQVFGQVFAASSAAHYSHFAELRRKRA
jgi:hypothetical protein